MRDNFEEKFLLWSTAIITYCKDTQVRSTALQIETLEYTPDLEEGYNTIIKFYSYNISFYFSDRRALMALRCLALLFAPMKTKKLEESIPYILKIVPVSTNSIYRYNDNCALCSVVLLQVKPQRRKTINHILFYLLMRMRMNQYTSISCQWSKV